MRGTHYPKDDQSSSCLCPICWQSLSGVEEMLKHVDHEHSETDSYVCLNCTESFDGKSALLNHIKTDHSQDWNTALENVLVNYSDVEMESLVD